jgi:hypothetical protein
MDAERTEREYMHSGHVGCPGCGATIAVRFFLKALGEKTVMVLPACCWSMIAGPYPQSTLSIPVIHAAFETGGATANIAFPEDLLRRKAEKAHHISRRKALRKSLPRILSIQDGDRTPAVRSRRFAAPSSVRT